jgi:hypothetical protein
VKTLIRYSRGRFTYTRRIRRAAFDAWADSLPGLAVVEKIAAQIRFSVFGKNQAARRRVWRQIVQAARSETVVVAMERELDRYLARLEKLVFAYDLPRIGLHLRRLVVVPRLFVNTEAYRRLDAALDALPPFVAVDGCDEPVRDWFVLTLIDGVEAAIRHVQPSPQRPLRAGNGWIAVGVNEQFEWRIAFDGPAWPGHYYVLEVTRLPITRAVRKTTVEAIARLEGSLPTLTRLHRNEILRSASLSLKQLLARA